MIQVRQADVQKDGDALADLARRCPMRSEVTVATVPGPRATAWERFVAPRTVLIAEQDGAAVGTLSVGERYTRWGDRRIRWSYLTDFLVLPEARDAGGIAALLVLEARDRELAAKSEFMGFVTPVGKRSVKRFALSRAAALAQLRVTCWHLRRRPSPSRTLPCRSAAAADLPRVWDLLRRHWDGRVLSPDLCLSEFSEEWTRDASLTLEDAVVAERNGAVVGFGALWDQRPLRQELVLARGFRLSILAAAARLWSKLSGSPGLTKLGSPVPLAWVRHFGATDLDAARAVRDSLLERARQRDLRFVMLALDGADPLAPVCRGYPHLNFASTLRIASIGPGKPPIAQLSHGPALVDFSVA
jgi:hypothetical protein